MRIKATEMVGVRLTTKEIRRLLDALAEGTVGSGDDPEVATLQRKLNVMLQVAIEVEKRPRPWEGR